MQSIHNKIAAASIAAVVMLTSCAGEATDIESVAPQPTTIDIAEAVSSTTTTNEQAPADQFADLRAWITDNASFRDSVSAGVFMLDPNESGAGGVLAYWLQSDGSVIFTLDARAMCQTFKGILDGMAPESDGFGWRRGFPPEGGFEHNGEECDVDVSDHLVTRTFRTPTEVTFADFDPDGFTIAAGELNQRWVTQEAWIASGSE